MKQRGIGQALFIILYLAAAGIIVTQVLELTSLTSMLFLLTFPLTVLLWVCTVQKSFSGLDLLMLATAGIAFINVLINAGLNDVDLSISYLRKVIMFGMSLMFFQTAYRARIGKNVVRIINGAADFLTVFFVVMYFLGGAEMYLINGLMSNYLTFHFSNPNLTGLFLTCLYMLELYRLFRPQKWYWKLLHLGMSGLLVWLILETESRNCLLVVAMFAAACVCVALCGYRDLYIRKWFAAVAAAFPAIFVIGYLALISSQWIQNIFAFLIGVGKKLDSRVVVWQPALDQVRNSPLIGGYCEISNGTGAGQMHNTHLDIAGAYGVLVLILVCVLLARYIYQGGRRHTSKETFIHILGFVCALMLGIGEGALFSGGLGIHIFAGAFLLLANQEGTEKTGEAYRNDCLLRNVLHRRR